MKKLIFTLLMLTTANSFAMTTIKEKYCLDKSTQVFFVKPDLVYKQKLNRVEIGTADLVVNLGDGTSVIVPCFEDKILSKEGDGISSLIILQENIFKKIENPEDKNVRGVGINFENDTVLVESNVVGILKSYSIHKSEKLKRLREEKVLRSIDKR